MSNNKKVCMFNKNHIIGKKSLKNHYQKIHSKEYSKIMNNGWFCRSGSKLFQNQIEMDYHMKECKNCQMFCGKKENVDENTLDFISISQIGLENIKNKLPKDKKVIDFPTLDFNEFKVKSDKITNLESELIKELIEKEEEIIF